MSLSPADLKQLQAAKNLLENPGLTAQLTSLLGTPIEYGLKKLPRKVFDKELRKLQVELCHLQEHVKKEGVSAIVIFEGTDNQRQHRRFGGARGFPFRRSFPGQSVKALAIAAGRGPVGMDLATDVTDPLRTARRRQGLGQPATDNSVIRAFAPLDRGHQRQRARGRIIVCQTAQRFAGCRKILGCNQKFGLQHSGLRVIGL